MKHIPLFSYFVVFLLFSVSVLAIDFVPQGNINGKNVYSIFNFTSINGTAIFQNGFKVLDTNSTITVSTANYSSFSNQSTFWAGVSSYLARWFYSVSSVLYFNESLANSLWNDSARIDGLNSSKLDITDQRYNESSRVNGLNSSKLDITDQRYNESARVDALNDSKLNKDAQINWTQLQNYPAACPPNNFMTQVGDTITCTSVQETPLSLQVDGNLTVLGNITGNINASNILNSPWLTSAPGAPSTYNASNITNPYWLNLTDQRYNESSQITSVNSTVANLLNDNSSNVKIGSANKTLVACQNITGATSNLCTLVDTSNTSAQIIKVVNNSVLYLPNLTSNNISASVFTDSDNNDYFLNPNSGSYLGSATFVGALVSSTLNTGQGVNELYAMDQNVRTSDNVKFVSINTTSNINTVGGNITVLGGYLFGQPLLGMMGSGIINSTQSNSLSEVNVSCSGLTCSYNAFEVRLLSGSSAGLATYCKIPAGSQAATNNAHNVLYIDSNCAVQVTTIVSWFETLITQGAQWDFANMVCYSGSCEVVNGIGLEQRRMMKQRVLNYWVNHLKVVSGFAKTTNTFPNWTLASGNYIYLMDPVSVPVKYVGGVSPNPTSQVEVIFPNLTTTAWIHSDQNRMNYTTCINSTNNGILTCTNTNRWRRIFFFMIGWNESGVDTSGLHQLLPLDATTYLSESACLDTTVNPITYTLPDYYQKAAAPVWAYCIRPSDTAWSATGWIDLRAVKAGSATSTSSAAYVPYSGATQNVDLGVFNLSTTDTLAGKLNASWIQNPPWLTSVSIPTTMPWANLTAYPAKCAAGQAVTNLSTGACSAFLTAEGDKSGVQPWLFNDSTTMTLNVSRLSLDYANISLATNVSQLIVSNATMLPKAGGTVTGNINISNTNNITGISCLYFASGGKICTGT